MPGIPMRILIVGGGIMGLSCAWRLAQSRCQVTLLEQRTCGGGATHASLGALWPPSPLADGPLQKLHRQSLSQMESFLTELAADSALPIPLRRGGRLEFLLDPDALTRATQEAPLGHPGITFTPALPGPILEILSPDQIRTLEPLVDPTHLHALHCRFTAQVDVAALIAALKAACLRRGVTILEQTPVDRLTLADLSFTVHTAGASGPRDLTADRLLITAGAWTAQLDPLLQRFAPTRPAKGQALMLATPQPLISHIVKRGTTYLVPWQDHILVGSTTEPEAGFDESTVPAAIETLRQDAIAILPALASAPVVRSWAGLRPDAPKHRPIMGPIPGHPQVFVCAGHYKTGIGMSPLVSRLIADFLTTGIVPPQLADFLPRDRSARPNSPPRR